MRINTTYELSPHIIREANLNLWIVMRLITTYGLSLHTIYEDYRNVRIAIAHNL